MILREYSKRGEMDVLHQLDFVPEGTLHSSKLCFNMTCPKTEIEGHAIRCNECIGQTELAEVMEQPYTKEKVINYITIKKVLLDD